MKSRTHQTWRLIGSYFVVGALPIVILSILTSSILFNQLKRDVEKLNINTMDQIQKKLDRNFMQFFSMTSQSADNEEIMEFLNGRQNHTTQTILLYYDIRQEMERHTFNQSVFADTAVYSSVNDAVIGKGGLKTPSEYYECYLRNNLFGEEEFINSLRDGSRRNFFYGTDRYIVCGQSLELRGYIDKGVFIALMDKADMTRQLQDMNSEINFAILNEDNSVLFQTGRDEMPEKLYEDGKTVICRDSEAVGSFRYVYSYEENMLSQNVDRVGRIFFLLILAAVLMSFVLANRNSKRMKSVIKRLTDENRMAEENLLDQIEKTREHMLRNLLKWLPSEDTIERLWEYNIRFTRNHICVVALGLYDIDEESGIGCDIWSEVDQSLLSYCRLKKIDCYPVKKDDVNRLYILCYDDKDLYAIYKNILGSLLGDYRVILAAGVGNEISSIKDIYWSAERAMHALNQSRHSDGEPVYYDAVCQSLFYGGKYYTGESEKQMIQNMQNGNVYGITMFFDGLYKEIFEDTFVPLHIMQGLLINLEATIYRALDTLYINNSTKYEKFDRICKKVLNSENFEESFQIFREICISICKDHESTSEKDLIKIKIKEFIDNNYRNYDISLEALAEYLGISYHSLSHMFKDYMGMNFVGYVTMVRMQKAVNILSSTDCTVQQAAEGVGFTGSSSFIKVFKKYYGITPAKYRENARNKGEKK